MPQAVRIAQRQEVMTFNDSVAMVKQSVRCSIGSIVYLRGLFPEENLANVRLKFRCEGEKDIDYVVKQLSKTATGEAKRMNDYIENGICDAIDKQYLSSLVLAIFLDEDDPHNVVEAYTFNFTYRDVSGQKGRVAAVDISTRMEDMSLDTGLKKREARRTSISTAPLGRTSFEVATDLRTLLRNVSTRVSMLYSLPRKRYATFKLYYTPDTPDEYEPPGFVGVDPEDARLYFATHHSEEVPDREVYGTLETGHHSVDLKVATLTHCIPSTDLTMDVDREERKAEIFEQAEDALNRNVIWSAEVDVQALKDAKDTVDSVVVESSVDVGPIGTRMRDGVVKLQEGGGVKTYVGAPSIRPADLEAFNDRDLTPGDVNTQPIQVVSSRATSPAGLAASRVTDTLQQADDIVRTLADGDDTEMLDADTQMPSARDRCALPDQPIGMDIDSRSLPRSTTPPSKPNQEPSSRTLRSTSVRKTSPAPPCSCGGKSDKRDPEIVCETCGGLYHICCMGYLGLDDSRIPRAFECFVCRLDRCPRAKMLPSDTRVEVENNWRALCLFRRALKVVRDGPVPPTALALSKRLACPNNLGQQMKKRLEDEGFIGPEVVETVDVFEESAPPKGKKKAKKPAKTAKGKLVIIWTEESKKRFMRYFKPGGTYERAIYNFSGGNRSQSIALSQQASRPRSRRSLTNHIGRGPQEPSATREPSTPKAPRGEASKAPGAAPRVSREPLLPRQETTDLLSGRDTVDDAPLEDIFSPTSNARKRSHSAAKPVTYASRKKLKMSLATGAMNVEE